MSDVGHSCYIKYLLHLLVYFRHSGDWGGTRGGGNHSQAASDFAKVHVFMFSNFTISTGDMKYQM